MVSADKVKVAVRVRPLNRREIELGSKCVVDMDSTQTILYNPNSNVKESNEGVVKNNPKTFAFDHCFWSISDNNPKYATQEMVFESLGQDILKRAFEGYNACLFAYGQTGSGKSYTMMGTQDQRGVIPRLCDSLFEHIEHNTDLSVSYKVEVSYLEIYNEKVRDLLDPKGRLNLKVREHNILGCYVDGLSSLAVTSFQDIDNLMNEGNKSRTVAATNMNNESSRSHAVFNVILTQTLVDLETDVSGEKVSKISLVDLAGSERAQKTGAVGDRLKEGSNINKSLTTLGLVISSLADQASGKNKGKFVPYRDSVLTWLLKDNLGGNSKTVMIATLSPSADNHEETLSTLRYADRAKRIVNHAVVNEDPNARIIRELREEVDSLRKMLSEAKQNIKEADLQERLEESEKLMKEIGRSWEDKVNETERIHSERHAALEQMGISVETSGIKVQQGKHYLVNLNADPCLNELLVYYLKEKTLIGLPDKENRQDIQLNGLGIMPEHCIITIEGLDVFIQPFPGARTCVNGRSISERTKVKHGDRIVWGNYHFFRLNCPKTSPSVETPDNIDFDFAQQELMLQQMVGDPIQEAINSLEKQHEEDKQVALENQRQMYESQMRRLKNQLMSPSTPSLPYSFEYSKLNSSSSTIPSYSTIPSKFQFWAKEREKNFRTSLCKLKEEVVRANTLVLEANKLAQELSKEVEYSVTLQIPAHNLSPNRKRGAFVSEPAILVKYKHSRPSQVWSMEKFENRVIDMRDYYEELRLTDSLEEIKDDPFFDHHEHHQLIGVANVFLEVFFYNAKLDYHVPIINQQGEMAGRLHVEVSRLAGRFIEDGPQDDPTYFGSFIESPDDESNNFNPGSYAMCRVVIKEAKGLPPTVGNLVFCQYNFWGCPNTIGVEPVLSDEPSKVTLDNITVKFNHKKEFLFQVTEEFLEHCADGALSIEVWGQRGNGLRSLPGWGIEQVHAKSRSMLDRWSELTRKVELWVEIHELNEQGEYMPVEVVQQKVEMPTGGAYQLKQGFSRRILVSVKPVQNSGTLPIILEKITQVHIGCVCPRSKLQKGLDSYQEEDLSQLRVKWSEALEKRREYLDQQLQRLMNKKPEDKSDADVEREASLIDQWVCLAEERNAVLVPAVGSGIPGAPADWEHPATMEQHIPVVFLDLNAEDMSTPNAKEGLQAVGNNSILPKEHASKFIPLSFVPASHHATSVLASWDSSIHDSIHLNRVTPTSERVYMILKVVVKLSHPAAMELVLRKRICVNVYKRQSITDKIKKRIGKAVSSLTYEPFPQDMRQATGVTFEIVSNVPKSSEELEDRESLAQIAASQNEQGTASDGETYIEKYIKGVSAVESILVLDRLRQDVAVKELLNGRGRPLRKATSTPNMFNIITSPQSLQDQLLCEQMAGDNSVKAVTPMGSNAALDFDLYGRHLSDNHVRSLLSPESHKDLFKKDCIASSPYLKSTNREPCKNIIPLTTLVEEKVHSSMHPSLQNFEEEEDYDDGVEEEEEEEEENNVPVKQHHASHHYHLAHKQPNYVESPAEFKVTNTSMKLLAHNKAPASLTSSGYGGSNQAISVATFPSEDSMSLQSCEDSVGAQFVAEDPTHHTHDASNDVAHVGEARGDLSLEDTNVENEKSVDKLCDKINSIIDGDNGVSLNSIMNTSNQQSKESLPPSKHNGMAVSPNNTHMHMSVDSIEHSFHEMEDSTSLYSFGSRGNLSFGFNDSLPPDWLVLNAPVLLNLSKGHTNMKQGVVRYIGKTEFSTGTWVGVELDLPCGKNDGSIGGVRYFKCGRRHGVFVRQHKLMPHTAQQPLKSSTRRSSNNDLSDNRFTARSNCNLSASNVSLNNSFHNRSKNNLKAASNASYMRATTASAGRQK